MAETVARAHTDECELGSQHGERLRAHGVRTAVVTELQHVDVTDDTIRDELAEDVAFRIPRQHDGRIRALDDADEARFVCRRICRCCRRPQHAQQHRTDAHAIARPERRGRLAVASIAGVRVHGSHIDDAVQPPESADMVLMHMGEDDRIESPKPLTRARVAQ